MTDLTDRQLADARIGINGNAIEQTVLGLLQVVLIRCCRAASVEWLGGFAPFI